jgi:uncharacterized membrane protein
MSILILGLVLFLGMHSLSTQRARREALISQWGESVYKAIYSIVSLIGFVLIVYGFSTYREQDYVVIWSPPVWTRHLALTLMWFAFVALASMGSKPSRLRGWLRHPMLVAIKIWALAHLLANGDLGGMILFGSFLAWAVFDRISVKRRGDMGAERLSHFTRADGVALVAGSLAYGLMLVLHPWIIGVAIFG